MVVARLPQWRRRRRLHPRLLGLLLLHQARDHRVRPFLALLWVHDLRFAGSLLPHGVCRVVGVSEVCEIDLRGGQDRLMSLLFLVMVVVVRRGRRKGVKGEWGEREKVKKMREYV